MGETAALLAISAMSTAMGVQQTRSQAKAQNQAAQTRADAQAKQLQASQEIEARREKERLRRNLATQRARFGASGAGGAGGSSEALLQGLYSQTERELDDKRKLNLLQTESIYSDLANAKRRNLLEARGKIGQSMLGLAEQGVEAGYKAWG